MKKWTNKLFMSLVFLLVVSSLAACGKAPAHPSSANNASNSGGGDEKVVNIGFSGPLSGGAANYGKNVLSGIELAAKEINESGGFEVGGEKYKLNVVALDDKYMPNETGINAKRLVKENRTPVIIVPHSGGTFALQEFNEKDGFIIASYSSEPKVTERGNKLTLRMPPEYNIYIEPFSQYAMGKFGKKLGLIPGTHAYAKDWTKAIKKIWTGMGGEIVAENPMDYNKDTDFYSGVSKTLAAHPDVLFVGGASEPTALVIKQARELGFKGGFIVMDQAKMNEMGAVLGGDDLLEGMVGVAPLKYYDRESAKQFMKKYEKEYNKTAGSEAAYNYLTTFALVEAMKLAGTVSDAKAIYAKLGDALSSMPKDKLVYQVTSMDEQGGLTVEANFAAMENKEPKIMPIKKNK